MTPIRTASRRVRRNSLPLTSSSAFALLLALATLVMVACGDDAEPTPSPEPATAAPTAAQPTPQDAPTAAAQPSPAPTATAAPPPMAQPTQRDTSSAVDDSDRDADEVMSPVKTQRDWGQPLAEGHRYLRAEVVHAVRYEAALHLDDVLTRRTRLSVEGWDRGVDSAGDVAALMGAELGWSPETVEREVQHYRARVEAERDSQSRPDDHTADAARLGAPDIRR